jgi:hypothetical protein
MIDAPLPARRAAHDTTQQYAMPCGMSSTMRGASRIAHRLMTAFAGGLLLAGCNDGTTPTDGSARAPDALRVSLDNSAGTALALAPRSATLMVGHGILLRANIVDAGGQPVAGAKASWRSTNSAVARVTPLADSGLVNDHGRAAVSSIAPGTALIIATYENVADTATITVVPRTDSGATPPPPAPPRASEFDLTVRVHGLVATGMVGDSILQRLDPIAGAAVTVTLLPPLANDTTPTGGAPITSPTVVGTVVTDAQGNARFTKVTSARYRIAVQPPAGSPWTASSTESAAPYGGTAQNHVVLRKP